MCRDRTERISTELPGRRHGAHPLAVRPEFGPYRESRRRISKRMAQRRRLNQARALDALKSQILDTVSHELKTPLTVILGYGRLLETGALGILLPEQRQAVERIARQSEALSSAITDLLDMATLHSGLYQPLRSPTCLSSLVGGAVARVRCSLGARTLRVAVRDDLPPVSVDGLRLVEVLVHLLRNAVKHTSENGTITLSIETSGGHIRCEVADDGDGIPPEALASIFEPFYQVDARTTRRTGGNGLGLALCRAIIEAHGGTMDVKSQLGVGSLFWFTFEPTP